MIHPYDEDGHILFTVMTLIQTIDNLKKKVPHAQIRGPTQTTFL